MIKKTNTKKELTQKDTKYLESVQAYDKLNAKVIRDQEQFSNIIDDIRAPMNGVLGFLELLQLQETDAKQKEYIETALKSGENMVALISDALDISEMSSRKTNIENVEFSIFEKLGDVARLFYNSAKKKEITLNTFYDPDLPQIIYSDYHRIKEIMNNLLNNAIKFTPNKGSISLELLYDKEVDELTVSVKDNGIGISKEMQKDIFNPCIKENGSTSNECNRTGLGLSISQQLAVLLGGKMELESEEGKGSKFYFTIPCNTKEGVTSSIEKKKIKNLSVLIYDSKNRNIHLDTVKRYMKSFNLLTTETKKDEQLKSIIEKKFDILVILKKDTISKEEEIQEILDAGKSIILMDEDYFKEEYNWFVGKIESVYPPLLPNSIFQTILNFINYKGMKKREDLINLDKSEGKRILVIDYNAINLKFMREVLKVFHIESILAHNNQESIEKFKNEKIDMIFIDENMPDMKDGKIISLIRKIEEENRLKHTIVIGLAGNADAKTKESILSSGVDDVLTKPIQLKEIANLIEKYL